MKRKLSFKETILVASTLFGMFFGAGNVIFPVHLGQLAGSNVIPAVIGFVVTGVCLPILAVGSIGITRSEGLQELSGKIGKGYSYFFTCALYLTIGPFFCIPRCATVSFATGISPMLNGASERLPLFLFSMLFFAAVLFFSLRPTGIMTWIGKIINPLFLAFLAVLVIAAMSNPSAAISSVAPAANYEQGAFFNGFVEGYGTMDAIAGLAFGIIIINSVRRLGVKEPGDVAKATLKSGLFTGLLMALIYVLTTIMGTQSRGLFETSENGSIALVQISNQYLGSVGGIVLALTITFACLKTAIALVTSCSETFSEMFQGKLKYNHWAIIFTLFSFAVSNVGLTAIINYAVPVLMLLYPLAISLIILAFLDKFFGGARSVYVCTTIGAMLAAIPDFIKTLPFGIDMSWCGKILPFFDLGLGWLVPAAIGFVIGLVISRTKKAQA